MRIEVRDYIRASSQLFGLAFEEGALTPTEREAIVSFAREVERKFLPSPQQDNMPWVSPLSNISQFDQPQRQSTPDFKGMEEHYDVSKMSEPECRTHRELDAQWAQNDPSASTSVGLSKSEMSPRVAERTH